MINKIKTVEEAWRFCEENGCKVEFWKPTARNIKKVEVQLGLIAETMGRDLIEAVNRIIDMYNTPPCNREKLEWWKDYMVLKYGKE